jgi:hypothetical protein
MKNEMGRACSTNGENAYRILVGKLEETDVGGWTLKWSLEK